jgi:hypothetical protein
MVNRTYGTVLYYKRKSEKQYGGKENRKRIQKGIKDEKRENMVNAVKQRKERRAGRENCS